MQVQSLAYGSLGSDRRSLRQGKYHISPTMWYHITNSSRHDESYVTWWRIPVTVTKLLRSSDEFQLRWSDSNHWRWWSIQSAMVENSWISYKYRLRIHFVIKFSFPTTQQLRISTCRRCNSHQCNPSSSPPQPYYLSTILSKRASLQPPLKLSSLHSTMFGSLPPLTPLLRLIPSPQTWLVLIGST